MNHPPKCWWCGVKDGENGPLLPNGMCRICDTAAQALKRSA
jgi:hypothetical protein